MAERVWRREDDDRAARPPDPSLRNHRNRQRELARQEPCLSATPACPGGSTGTSRAALRRTRGGRSAPRGSLLWTTWTSPEATCVGQDSIGDTAQSGSRFNR